MGVNISYLRASYLESEDAQEQRRLLGIQHPVQVGRLLEDEKIYFGKPIPQPAEPEALRALCDGTGILSRAPVTDARRCGWMLTFTVGKSVSMEILALRSPETWTKTTEQIVQECVKPAVERVLDAFRTGKKKEPVAGAYGEIHPEALSKLREFHAHFHSPIPNAVRTESGKVQCVENAREVLYHAAFPVINAEFQKRLSDHFAKQGIVCELDGHNTKISAIPKELCDAVSESTKLIKALKDLGIENSQTANYLVRKEEDLKLKEPLKDLRACPIRG